MRPYISVIIPVYNRGWQLQRALNSLALQTDNDFEVIVCDDGSTEDICTVIQPYLCQLRLKYVRINNSGGPARPRNVAASYAKGEWLSFLDSDDWWDSDKIAIVKPALNEAVDLLYHSLRVVSAKELDNRREKRKVIGDQLRDDSLRHMFLYGNPIPNSAALIRRSWFEKIGGLSEDKELVALEDFDAWLRVAAAGGKIQFLNQVLGSYWVGEDAISAISAEQICKHEALFARHHDSVPVDIRQNVLAVNRLNIASLKLKLGKIGRVDARKMIWNARPLPTLSLKLKRIVRLVQSYYMP